MSSIFFLNNSKILNSLWGLPFFDNRSKVFFFKLHNNQLGVNSRVAHFVRGHNSNCTFCTLNNNNEDNPESIAHLFFDCEYTENLLERFFSIVFNVPSRMVTRSEYFVGFNTQNENNNKVLLIITAIVKQYIWDCKLRFNTPSIDNLLEYFRSEFGRMVKNSRKFAGHFNRSTLFNNNPILRF